MCQKLRWAKEDAVSIWNCLALEFDSQGGGEESAGEQATMWVACKRNLEGFGVLNRLGSWHSRPHDVSRAISLPSSPEPCPGPRHPHQLKL